MGPFDWTSNENIPQLPPLSLYIKSGLTTPYDSFGFDLRKWTKELLDYLHVYTWDESCQGPFNPDYSYLISADYGNSMITGTDGKLFVGGASGDTATGYFAFHLNQMFSIFPNEPLIISPSFEGHGDVAGLIIPGTDPTTLLVYNYNGGGVSISTSGCTWIFNDDCDLILPGAIYFPDGSSISSAVGIGQLSVSNFTTTVSAVTHINFSGATFTNVTPGSLTITPGVISVGMTVPSAFAVSPSAITTSGTFAISAVGHSTDYIDGTGALQPFPIIPGGTVTHVGMTGSSAFAITGAPITAFGTINISGSGTTSQYIAGDGTLAYISALPFTPQISATTGSVFFSGGGTSVLEDNANFFWDDINNRLGVGTNSPQRRIHSTLSSVGTTTALALENTDTTNNNGNVLSFRSATTGVGASSFVEFGAVRGTYEEHNHATHKGRMSIWTKNLGTLQESLIVGYDGQIKAPYLSSASTSSVLYYDTVTGLITYGAPGTSLNGVGFVKVSGTTVSYDNTTYYPASNPSGFTSNTGTVTSIATAGLLAGGTITSSGTITTSINTNKLVGRTTAGTGVMEEITVGSGLSLSAGTLSVSGITGTVPHATASGTDTYTSTIPGVTAYNDGDAYIIQFTNGNTTSATLNINSLGAIPLYRNNDGALIGGDIVAGGEMLCVYDNTVNGFRVIGTAPNTLLTYVTNAEAITITKGQPVYVFGGQGDRITVKLAYNTSDATSAQTIGVVQSTSIGANQKGLIIIQGQLDGLSLFPTSTWADGDYIYLGATAGTITNVKPHAPNHLVYLGYVTTASNGAAGRWYVKVQNGYELDEIHNVLISGVTNNDILAYESATSLWKNKSIATVLGYTPQAQLSGTGFVKATGTTISYDNTTYLSAINSSQVTTALGYTPVTNARNLTINGVTYDLSADRSWSITAGVSSVSASLPLSSSGGSTPNITISQATTSTNGYLSSTDWNTFNSKQAQLSGTGFVKAAGSGITYDNTTYYPASNPSGWTSNTGTVTSVAALTIGTTGTDLSSTVANGTTTPVITLNVPTASSTNRGVLSSTDWTTFNNKQNALGFTPPPNTRTITINGVTQDLSADRTYTVTVGNTAGINLANYYNFF